jgi:hypothetical protein
MKQFPVCIQQDAFSLIETWGFARRTMYQPFGEVTVEQPPGGGSSSAHQNTREKEIRKKRFFV